MYTYLDTEKMWHCTFYRNNRIHSAFLSQLGKHSIFTRKPPWRTKNRLENVKFYLREIGFGIMGLGLLTRNALQWLVFETKGWSFVLRITSRKYIDALKTVSFLVRSAFHDTILLLQTSILKCTYFNLLATDFFLNFSTPVFKMWVIQKPNKVALWNKRHFEGEKMEIIQHV